jgi:glycerophosphoryl diester phosphodiesterase
VAEPATLRLAHRGDWRAAPENSLDAIQAALRIPACHGAEFDVRASSDGVPILLHDDSLLRVQGVDALPSALTAAECTGYGVSTLADVLGAVDCDAFLDVELKEHVPGVIDVLEVERGRLDGDGRPTLRSAVISTFDREILARLSQQCPTWPRWLNAMDLSAATVGAASSLGCEAIACWWRGIDEAGVARARDAGLGFAAWTVTDPEDYRRLVALGALAICAEGAALDG